MFLIFQVFKPYVLISCVLIKKQRVCNRGPLTCVDSYFFVHRAFNCLFSALIIDLEKQGDLSAKNAPLATMDHAL